MTLLALQDVVKTGLAPTFQAAAAGGDTMPTGGGRAFLRVRTSGTASTVTVNSVVNCNQGFDHDLSVVLAATDDQLIGPFDVNRFGEPAAVAYTSVVGVTVAAIRVPSP